MDDRGEHFAPAVEVPGEAGERSPIGGNTETVSGLPERDGSDRGGRVSPGGAGLPSGSHLGRYITLYALGSGGMGDVYAAYDPELDRKVALKVLRREVLGSAAHDEAHRRLLREARAIARLTHPNVVTVHDVGVASGRVFLAMELIDGHTVANWLAAEPRSWRQVLHVFQRAGQGLAAAHAAGLVHRDFKPKNVMVADGGRVLVLDFGLARAARAEPSTRADETDRGSVPEASASEQARAAPADSAITAAGKTVGTPAYMAPEQRAGGQVGPRADQYSFCVALAEALGKVDGSPAPGWVLRIVERGMGSEPDERFASMDALLAALDRDPAAMRKRWLSSAAVLAAVVAAIGALALATHHSGPDAGVCAGADDRLAGLWDDSHKRAIKAGFLAADSRYAEGAWLGVEKALDEYMGGWRRVYRDACEATRVRGEQSEDMLDRQMACLDTRLRDVRAAVDLLAQADAEVVDNALAVASSPGSLSRCSDRDALLQAVPPPRDPELSARVSELRGAIARSRAQQSAGKYQAAYDVVSELGDAVTELGYEPLRAEYLVRLAQSSGRVGKMDQMRDSLIAAARAGQAAHHDEAVAEAFTYSIIGSIVSGRFDEAHRFVELARGAIDRLGGHDELERQHCFFVANLAMAEGRWRDTMASFQSCLDRMSDATALERGAISSNLGVAATQLGELDQAERYLSDALAWLIEAKGAEHPHLIDTLDALGSLLYRRGRLQDAAGYYRQSLDIAKASLPAGHPRAALGLIGLGRCLLASERADQAVSRFEEALALYRARPSDPGNTARTAFLLARALWASGGDRQRARDLATEARAIYISLADQGRDEQPALTEIDAWLAERGSVL